MKDSSGLCQPSIIKYKVKRKAPPACGQPSAADIPTPGLAGPFQIPDSSPSSPPPSVYSLLASGRNPGYTSHSGCGCPERTLHKPSPPRRHKGRAVDTGCGQTYSYSYGAPRKTPRAGCFQSSRVETGSDSTSTTEACGKEKRKKYTKNKRTVIGKGFKG